MEKLIAFFVGSALISGILVFLGKLVINKGFDAAMKTFENKLELMKIEHQVRFSQLHQERAVVTKDMYKMLYELKKELEYYTTSFQGQEWLTDTTRRDKVLEVLKRCRNLVEENRIFFVEEFCEKVEKNLLECEEVIRGMEKARSLGREERRSKREGIFFPPKDGKTSIGIWIEQEEKVKIEIRKNRIKLAEEFRKLLGVREE